MKPSNIFCFILLLALESNIIISSCFAGSKIQFPGSPWQVTIINYQTDSTLVAHCKSKDDDLGEHIIDVGGQYDWMFKENFWQTTLFWCNFRSKYGHASFEVFWPEAGSWLSDRCGHNNCVWAARNNGFYLENTPLQRFQLIHRWETGA